MSKSLGQYAVIKDSFLRLLSLSLDAGVTGTTGTTTEMTSASTTSNTNTNGNQSRSKNATSDLTLVLFDRISSDMIECY